jgi:hypothetical protein
VPVTLPLRAASFRSVSEALGTQTRRPPEGRSKLTSMIDWGWTENNLRMEPVNIVVRYIPVYVQTGSWPTHVRGCGISGGRIRANNTGVVFRP